MLRWRSVRPRSKYVSLNALRLGDKIVQIEEPAAEKVHCKGWMGLPKYPIQIFLRRL